MDTLIVMIDPNEKMVYLFGAYTRQFQFDDVYAIAPFLEGRNVMYVVQAEECDGDTVLDQIEALNVPGPGKKAKKYIRINKEGYTWVPEIKKKFGGPKDAKPVDEIGRDVFLKSPTMRRLLLAGSVEIMTESQLKAIRKPRPDSKAKDRELDKMILTEKAKDFSPESMFGKSNEETANDVTDKDGELTEDELAMKRLGI